MLKKFKNMAGLHYFRNNFKLKNNLRKEWTLENGLLFTIVFNIFLFRCIKFSFCIILFLSPGFFFFQWETFHFTVRLFMSLWDFFFQCNNFSFPVRLFLLPRNFFLYFWCHPFSFQVRVFLCKVKISGQPYKKDLVGYVA